jgi:hypothetical protein
MTLDSSFPPDTAVDPVPPPEAPGGADTPYDGTAEPAAAWEGGEAEAEAGRSGPPGEGAEAPELPAEEEAAGEDGRGAGAGPEEVPHDGPAAYAKPLSFERVEGAHVNIGETHYHGERERAPERLGRKHCEALEPAPLTRRLRGIEWPRETLRPLEEHVEQRRFLILSGETGLGKGSLALAVAARLLRRRPGPQRVLLAGRPSPDLQIDLVRWAGEEKESVLVVEDAFVHANPWLARLVERLDANRLRNLDDALRGAGCWVLLTASPESVPGDAARLEGLGAQHAVAEPCAEELRRGLYRLAQLRLGGTGCSEEDRAAVERLLDADADELCRRLRTLPRLAAFVDGYLLAAARGELGWEAAADRVDGLGEWLFEELATDPAAWSFALALTLAGAVPALGDPPLFSFDSLWRRLEGAVREELAGDAPPPRPLAALGVGESLLRRTRSEIAGSRPPTVRFRDPQTSVRLWRALVEGPGRQIAGLLIGWLRPLLAHDDPRLREAAARALGRLGVLDPIEIVPPLVERWVRQGDLRCFDGTLGGLLQGAVAAGDDEYLRATLRRLARGVDGEKKASHIGRAAALRDLGEVDTDLAMGEMRGAFADEAAVLVDSLWRAHRDAQKRLQELTARRGEKVAEAARQRLYAEAVPRHVPTAVDEAVQALRYGLVGLGLVRDPVEVLDRLRPWLDADANGEAAGPASALASATALVLLRERGVLHLWEQWPITVPLARERGDFAFSRPIFAVAADDGAAQRLAEAMAGALAATSRLPPPLAWVLRANWLSFFVRWGSAVGESESFDEALADVLRRMLPLTPGNAGDEIFALLKSHPRFRGDDGALSAFAAGILAG